MMGLFFVYIVKSSVCLAGFYLFYRLLLSKETFHRFNRIALLTLLLLSLLLPLVQLTTIEQTEVHQTMLTIEQLLMMADMPVSEVTPAEAVTLSGIQILLMVYLSGVLFFRLPAYLFFGASVDAAEVRGEREDGKRNDLSDSSTKDFTFQLDEVYCYL